MISDKQARLKPCLRCGYSLRYVAGFKNCPECGLAVRVSLSGNDALEWTSPRWQRTLAVGFGVLSLGLVCRLLDFIAQWVMYWSYREKYSLGSTFFWLLIWLKEYALEAEPIICGVGLCLLARGERRYPDESRQVRRMTLAAGVLIIWAGLINDTAQHLLWRPGRWGWYLLTRTMYGPWIPLVISALAFAYATHFGKRGMRRLLLRLAPFPFWMVAAGGILWIVDVDGLFMPVPLRSLLLDGAFPLSMIVLSILAIQALLSGAREAEFNWVTDF